MLKTITKKAILKFLSASDKLARFPPKWASSKFLLKIPNVLDQNEIKIAIRAQKELSGLKNFSIFRIIKFKVLAASYLSL